jgi:arsenate reductase
MAARITVFHYEKCQTCVKARKWLGDQKVTVELRPIVEQPPSVAELKDLWQRSGLPLKKFFNTSGQSYRALPDRDKLDTMADEAKLKLLAKDGKLIKRPILDDGEKVLVGFDAADYAAWRKSQRAR